MNVVWSPGAERDLDEIWEYIAADNMDAADRVADRLRTAANLLCAHPRIGRAGRRSGTRELVVSGTPYFLEYRLKATAVEITQVIHGARKWPP